MKIFLDTADVDTIKRWKETGLINGVTTNPTHLHKADKEPIKVIKAICALLPEGVISVQITESDPKKAYKQARAIAQLADNIVVKVPCHINYYAIIQQLVEDEIPINVTLVFTLIQGLMMSKLGVAYISPFIGRWDDNAVDEVPLLYQLRQMIDHYGYATDILAASIRSLCQFQDAILAGVDAITVPEKVLEHGVHHLLTDQGIEKFAADWRKLGVKQFP